MWRTCRKAEFAFEMDLEKLECSLCIAIERLLASRLYILIVFKLEKRRGRAVHSERDGEEGNLE